jgi:hypothetical protein
MSIAPKADKGAASLVYMYFGDSKFTSLFQETLKLKKAMEDYKFTVLLKHESLPPWADLSEKDEKLADIKDLPTRANLFKYLIELAQEGWRIDLFKFAHGWKGKFKASTGVDGSEDYVTTDDILNELAPAKTGLTCMPIRIVYGIDCFAQTQGETWRSVGAKTTAGARLVDFYPDAYGHFIDDWNKGDVSFDHAVGNSQTDAAKNLVQTYLSTVHAPEQKLLGKWGGCPFGKFVLGDDPCARDYFVSCWLAEDEWQKGQSGKDNMNYSS